MAYERRDIPLTNLLLDVANPRLGDDLAGQQDAIRQLGEEQGSKLVTLAEHIAANGQDPSTVCLVVAASDSTAGFVVLEGNRRVAALKLLHSAELASATLSSSLQAKFRALRSRIATPIDRVECAILPDEESALPWLRLRHSGESGGAGVVPWSGINSQRFEARHGKAGVGLSVLHLLERHAGLLPEPEFAVGSDFPITTLERLLGTKKVRELLGLEFEDGQLHSRHGAASLVRALGWIVQRLASGETTVGDLHSAAQRHAFIEGAVPQNLLPGAAPSGALRRPLNEVDERPHLLSHEDDPDPPKPQPRPQADRKTKPIKPRDPKGPVAEGKPSLRVEHPRGNAIYGELKRLRAGEFPNAVGVLLRLFLELSVDQVIKQNPSSAPPPSKRQDREPTLRQKLKAVADWLVREKHLTKDQLTGIRHTASGDELGPGTVDVLHAWVHSAHLRPTAAPLKSAWDSWLPFLEYVWK